MTKATFPAISIPNAIEAFLGWGLHLSEDQFRDPKPEFLESVYGACLQQVTGITLESLQEPIANAVSSINIQEQEMYIKALLSNTFIHHLTRFAQAANIPDFSSADVYDPDPKRTLTILAAFINFIKFTEQKCEPFARELRERSSNLVAERDRLAGSIDEIGNKINTIKMKIAEDEPRCEQLREENQKLRSKLFATKELQSSVSQEAEKLKAEKNAVVKRKAAVSDEIEAVSDSISRTRSRIVQSPERIKRNISTMSATVAQDRKTITLHESKHRELQSKLAALQSIDKDVRSCLEQLQTIEKENRSLQNSQKELNDLKDHYEHRTVERTELQQRKERVEKQLANAQEKLERAQRHAEDKKQSSQRTIERLQKEYDEMVVERRDNDKQLEALQGEADDIETKMAEHLRQSEAELNELLAEYWKMRHKTDIYMETLANKLNMKVSSE